MRVNENYVNAVGERWQIVTLFVLIPKAPPPFKLHPLKKQSAVAFFTSFPPLLKRTFRQED